MILLPWDKDRCPNCGAEAVSRWSKLYKEIRACPACGGKVELSRISRSLVDGIWIGFGTMAVFLLLSVVADPGWGSLALVMGAITAVAWLLTCLPLAPPQGSSLHTPERPFAPQRVRAAAHVAVTVALVALAAGFLVVAVTVAPRDQLFVLIVLSVGIGIGAAIGLFFDLPLVAATATSDRTMDRWSWPKQPWLRSLLRGAVRLAVGGALAFAFVKAIALLD